MKKIILIVCFLVYGISYANTSFEVFFNSGKTNLEQHQLRKFKKLKKDKFERIEVQCFATSDGSLKLNKILLNKRSKFVIKTIIKKKIKVSKLKKLSGVIYLSERFSGGKCEITAFRKGEARKQCKTKVVYKTKIKEKIVYKTKTKVKEKIVYKRKAKKHSIKGLLGYGPSPSLEVDSKSIKHRHKPLIGVGYDYNVYKNYTLGAQVLSNETVIMSVGFSF